MSYAEACALVTFITLAATLWYIVSIINAAERRIRRKVRRWPR